MLCMLCMLKPKIVQDPYFRQSQRPFILITNANKYLYDPYFCKVTKIIWNLFSGVRGPPLNVTLKTRDKNSLDVSWNVPEKDSQNSELTGYQVCFYTKDKRPECLALNSTKIFSLTLDNLLPSTKYFVTVSASTKAGYGERSLEVSQITNGGNLLDNCTLVPFSYFFFWFVACYRAQVSQ